MPASPTTPPRKLRVQRLEGGPVARGAAHGEMFREDIRRYAEDRVRLASNGTWAGRPATREQVLALAEAMLPAHAAYAPDLHDELLAMASAAGITPGEAVIVGGFTDFVDTLRARAGDAPEEDDCTAALVPDVLADGAGFFVQTWDMHDSATEHVVLLDLRPDDGPAAMVFTTVGCLAQIGMNEAGIAIGINNLVGADGQIGVTWPTVVRKVLQQEDLEAALACILDAPLAGAHDYLLMDATGAGYNVEAMPTWRAVTELGSEALVHTNHALDAGARAREAARSPDLVANSHARLDLARELLRRPDISLGALQALTAEATTICRRSEAPHHLETSGAAICRPRTRELWAVWGPPTPEGWERFVVGRP